jgi:hypothetical protein
LAWASHALSSSPAGTAVADLVRIAEFVELEQFGRQRLAAGVSLTLVLVDVYFQFPDMAGVPRRCACGRALVFPRTIIAGQALFTSAQIGAFLLG